MDRTDAAESREKHDGLNPFEKFVEVSTKVIGRAPFFAVVVAIVVIWAASHPLWRSTTDGWLEPVRPPAAAAWSRGSARS